MKTSKAAQSAWEIAALGELLEIRDRDRIPVNADERAQRRGIVPYYGATGQVGWIDDFIFDEELILLGEDGAPFLEGDKPKAYVIRGKTWVNNHAHVLRAFASSPSAFWKYQLDQVDFHAFVSGTTRLKLSQGPMRQIPLLVPPLPEQHRIVEALESYFTRLDDAVATLERVRRNLKRYRASVLKAAVEGRLVPTEAELARSEGRSYEPASVLLTHILAERRRGWEEAELASVAGRGKCQKDDEWKAKYVEQVAPDMTNLPELPEGWCWAFLTELHAHGGFVSDGDWVESKHQDAGGTFRLTQLQDIGDGVFRDRSRRFMNEEQVTRLRCTHLAPDDVLIARMPDPLGRACVFPGLASPAVTAVDVCIVRMGAGACDPRWLVHFLNSPRVRSAISQLQSGSTRKRISRGNLCAIPLPVPPVAEQIRIRQDVDRLLSLVEDLQLAVAAQKVRAARLRQSILKWAFEGLLVDQDPSDEPASDLLERIRAERASASNEPTDASADGKTPPRRRRTARSK